MAHKSIGIFLASAISDMRKFNTTRSIKDKENTKKKRVRIPI